MKNTIRRLLPLCLALLLLCQLLVLTACNQKEDTKPADNKPATSTGKTVDYSVTVRTEGGMALAGIELYVYADKSMADLVWAGKTDASGVMTFSAAESSAYVATLKGVPEGYTVEASYPLTAAQTVISLAAKMATNVDLSTITVKTGDIMFDFSVTDTAGTTHTLSELLKGKQAVVLSFWSMDSASCKTVFPYLQQAYAAYSDKLEVLALNPVDTDAAAIAAYKQELGLTFPVAACEADWAKAFALPSYPTTVVIDRFSNVSLIYTGEILSAEAFEEIFAHYVAADYTQGVVDDVTDLTPSITGDKVEFGGVQEFDVTVPADGQIPVDLYKVSNQILEIKSKNVYVVYGGETYTPVNGVLTLPISAPDTFTAVSLMIGNSGKAEETFHATLSMPQGSMGNPYTMSLGQFTASVEAGNNQGVFYTYTAEKTGVLTVTCVQSTAGVEYGYTLYNLDSYAYKTLDSDGSKNASGRPVLSINVVKGNKVQFSAAALPNENNEYPAASFTFQAAFEEKDVVVNTQKDTTTYTITVKDAAGKAVPGAAVYALLGSENKRFATDASGVASINLEQTSCVFVLSAPKGYTAAITTVRLTADKPAATFTVTKKTVATVTYSVTVKDADGKTVSGALVVIGNQYATTGADGKVSIALESGSYDAIVSPPAGYGTPAPVKLTAAAPNGTVTLVKAASGGPSTPTGNKSYSVTVTDANGKAQTGIMVKFVTADGSVAALVAVDNAGVATTTLEAGNYTAELLFSGTALGYDRKAAALSADKTAIKVIVADGVAGEPLSVYGGTILAEPVRLGGTYVELLSNATADNPNYFAFTPDKTGVYQFTTSNPAAVITNWGGNPQYLYNSTEYTATNTFTVNIKDLGDGYHQFLGIHGASECVILVTRLGDPILTVDDLPYETYKTTATLSKFNKPAGTVSYVDITKQQTVVLGSDGYYHLGSASGPKLYVNLGESSPYLSVADVAANGGMKDYIYDANGEFVKKIEFNSCLYEYYGYTDNTTNQWVEGYTDGGFYPLTADLMYILQTHTKCYGWSDSASKNYLFLGKTVNVDSAWLFCVCTIG